jgi:3'-phosphoadenosine 5'-phosphosulfate sulfotransferase (PAPS reductase)/FAD synthetase
MRDIDQLVASAAAVLHRGLSQSGGSMAPLLSGGHDSICAVHIASQSRWFDGRVNHIDTGIGAAYTRTFVENVCARFGWKLCVWKSSRSFEWFVSRFGFPGPGMHGTVYNILKDRCVDKITRGRKRVALVNGARSQESVRRMGHVEAIHLEPRRPKRVWVAPCHDWSKSEQQTYMDEFGLPINRIKVAVGLSGECFCGAFAQPGEIDLIGRHAPDVATEINRLSAIALESQKPCQWGTRPNGRTRIAKTGPMCSGCDQRAAASGIVVEECSGL